nr:hypothetical protein [Pseudonocardia sp. C8]
MARHRHAVSVRTDGLSAVLGPLLGDARIRSAALIDVDSGMVLDVCGPDTAAGRSGRGRAAEHDHRDEVRGAAHAELVRIGLALAPGCGGVLGLVLEAGPDRHLLQTVPDPHGGGLVLSVVVRGSDRALARVRKRLRAVSEEALTAGPSTAVRPGTAGWALPGPAGRQPPRETPDRPPGPWPAGPATGATPPHTATPHGWSAGGGPSVPAALPSGGVDRNTERDVERTEPQAAVTGVPAPPPQDRARPGPAVPPAAMLPAPRVPPPAPAAPADPVDPAPAER